MFSFTGLQIIQSNPEIEQNQNIDKNKNQKTIQQKIAAHQTSYTPETKKYLKKNEKIEK